MNTTHPANVLPSHLLATKLFVPPARANLVVRARLFERLQAGLMGKLTLIAAPAGFGKTTLLSAWRATEAGSDVPFAWVSLDSADNDPLRFWSYVIAALDTLAPGVGASALMLLHSPQPPAIERILTNVLNAFSTSVTLSPDTLSPDTLSPDTLSPDTLSPATGMVLVLDDYHVITTPAIHTLLAWLIDYLPANLHMVILTRADPALPLARLRVRGALTELHASDLRFTVDEIAAFLNQTMGLTLTVADVAALEARTEGWIAGLQLAALAMRDHRDRSAFIRTFTGSNRYIVDYLAAEVFTAQSPQLQTFLLYTAILDRMCGSLCDALLEATTHESAGAMEGTRGNLASPSQLLLEELERANLFVIPLDDERKWYRYHHLFAEVLRQRLQSGTPSTIVTSLHARASVWYEGQGLVAEAIQHARLAQDTARVAHLVGQHGVRIIVGGETQTVLDWLNALPEALFRAQPVLCTTHALAFLFTNQLAAAETRIQDAEAYIEATMSPAEVQFVHGYASAVRANIARYTGDLAGCVAYAQQVLRLLPESETIARSVAHLHISRAFRVSGEVTEAQERKLLAITASFRGPGNLLPLLAAITNLARLQILQGRLHAAAATFGEMAQIATEPNQPLLLEGPAYYAGMGELFREWNELEEADRHLSQAMEQLEGRVVVDVEDVALAYLSLTRLHHARGEIEQANLTLENYLSLARRRGFVAHLVARGLALQARLALAQGNLHQAQLWAENSGLRATDELIFVREAEYLTLARVWIAQASEHAEDAEGSLRKPTADLLARLLHDATTKARTGSVLEILLVRALALWADKAREDALVTIAEALKLAAPEGFIRRFVDEGAAMLEILRAFAERGAATEYLKQLLAAFPGAAPLPPRQTRGGAPEQHLLGNVSLVLEPLSQRELEVLRLIAEGKSNAEVAQILVIALSTVKTHTNSIFSKWQVTSRTQAIQRARELNLL